MKKLLQTLCLCLLLLPSCRPDGVLSKGEMTDLLADLYLTDGFIEAAGDASQVWDSLDVYGPVLAAHGVTVESFDASVEYYLRHTKEFTAIFKDIEDRLEAEGQRIDDRDVEEEEIEEMDEEVREAENGIWEGIEEASDRDLVKEVNRDTVKDAKKDAKKDTGRKKGRKKLSKKELEELEKQLEK